MSLLLHVGLRLRRNSTSPPVLGPLSLAPDTATVGVAYNGVIVGSTFGSAITASSSDGTVLTVTAGVVTGTFTAAGSPTITLTETLAGAIGSPHITQVPLTVASAHPVLGTLTLTPTTATAGSAYVGMIGGATMGSTVTATSTDSTALTVSAGAVHGTFATAGSPTVTLTETLSGASNSPHSTPIAVTVSASVSGLIDPGTGDTLIDPGTGDTLTPQ